MLPNQLCNDLQSYQDKYNRSFYLIDYLPKQYMLKSWQVVSIEGDNQLQAFSVPVKMVSPRQLQRLSIWDKLPKNQQYQSSQPVEQPVSVNTTKNAKQSSTATTTRNTKVITKITQVTCSKCKANSIVNPYQLNLKAIRANMKVEQYAEEYICPKCAPKKVSKYEGMTDELTCNKCKKTTKYHPSMIKSMAKRKKLSIEDLLVSYRCKKCFDRKRK